MAPTSAAFPLWDTSRRDAKVRIAPNPFGASVPQRLEQELKRLARSCQKVLLHLRTCGQLLMASARHTGSSIVDVVYGIESNKEHLIKIANEVMGQFEEMLVPGAFLVDIIPARK